MDKNYEVIMDLVMERLIETLDERDENLMEGSQAILEDDEIFEMV